MSIEAELADGRVLEFPDGTDPLVIQSTVKKMIGASTAPQTTAPSPKTFGQNVLDAHNDLQKGSLLSDIGGMISGGATQAVSGLAGIAGAVLPGPEGQGADWVHKTEKAIPTYRPAAPGILGTIGNLMQTGSSEGGAALGRLIGRENEGRLIGDTLPTIVGSIFGLKAPLKSIAKTPYTGTGIPSFKASPAVIQEYAAKTAEKAAVASSADWQRAATIESAKAARNNGIILNPSSVSGTPRTALMTAAGGSDHFNTAASIANKSKWNDLVRQDLGLGKNVPLTAETYDAVRKRIAKPYDDATSLGKLSASESSLKAIADIDIPEILPAGETAAGKMSHTTDYVISQINDGEMTGKMAVNTTKSLRKEAKATFDAVKQGQVDPLKIEAAKAKMQLAAAIDDVISSNIADPKWKTVFDTSRRRMAQSYSYERATNLARQQVDPQVFAQEMTGRHYLTGNAKLMGEIAANHPEIANVYATSGSTFGMPVRSGIAGTTGFALGSLYGSPVATSAISAGAASIGERIIGKRLRTEAGQAKYATPIDRRIPIPEPEVPAPPPILQLGASGYIEPTPFRESKPNFTMGGNPPPNMSGYSNPSATDYIQPQIGMSRGEVGGQTGALRMEDARIRAESMRQGQALEAAQSAAESAAPRKPTTGGVQFDLDPVTGKLIPTSSTTRRATPDVQVIESTGKNLSSAAEKVAASKGFDMTAAEKVAWNKTKVDVLQSIPDFNGLSAKQILSKVQDRQWTEQLVQKLRQQDQMYADIAKRSQDQMSQSIARVKREQLMDQVEQLQNILGTERPSSRGYAQGPKTRAHQRGLLTGSEQ